MLPWAATHLHFTTEISTTSPHHHQYTVGDKAPIGYLGPNYSKY